MDAKENISFVVKLNNVFSRLLDGFGCPMFVIIRILCAFWSDRNCLQMDMLKISDTYIHYCFLLTETCYLWHAMSIDHVGCVANTVSGAQYGGSEALTG